MLGLLVRRHLRTSWGAMLVLALVTLLAAAAATTAARAVADMRARQVDHATQHLTPLLRDAVTIAGSAPAADPGLLPETFGGPVRDGSGPTVPDEPAWDGYLAGMTDIRDAQPEPLRSVLGEPDFAVGTDPYPVQLVPDVDIDENKLVVRASPSLREQVRLVDGAWPVATPIAVAASGPVLDEPVQVVVTGATADVLGWEVGDEYGSEALAYPPVRVVGIVEPVDPDASAWYHQPFGRAPQVVQDLERGNLATSAAYTAPAMIDPITALRGAQTRLWYPVSTEAVGAGDVERLAAQVRGLTHSSLEVVPGDPVRLQPRTELAGVLDDVLGERAGTDAILAVLVVGPLGAVAAVMVLAARLVVDRRRSALAVLRARGMTGLQVRALTAVEGLVVSVPAALAGLGAGLLAWPGAVTVPQVLLTLAAALAPAVAAATATMPRGLRTERSDLTAPGRSRLRLVAELTVLGLAALSAGLLLSRGVVAEGVDPLLAATPLLVSVAATLAAVRVTPFAARGLERLLARRRDLVPYLGAARATRASAGGVVPALALVLSVSVATSSAVLLSTLDAGVEQQARVELGADVRATGPVVGSEAVASLRDVDGVADVATVARLDDQGRVAQDGPGVPVAVLVADTDALARAQVPVPGGLPGGLAGPGEEGAGGAVPAMVHDVDDVVPGSPATLELGDEEVALDVSRAVGTIPGVPSDVPFVLVDAASAAALDVSPEPRTVLLAFEPDADAREVAAAVADALPGAEVDDLRSVTGRVLESPSSAGIAAGAAVAVAVAAALSLATVVLMLVLATPARRRLLAVLRSMGLRGSEARGVVGWEVGPWAAVALVVGALLGVAVPLLLRASVDLRPLTGGDVQPPLVLDPWSLLLAGAGFVVVVALGVGVSAALGRRTATVDRLRAETE
ncbi:FtsX-like permease family protein [Isoptericola cucumis]|uniref:FtsX-like permease family protein n=1 Tax=Isoptericola cucumis TaxID=1776856 RepID=UPI0032086CA1